MTPYFCARVEYNIEVVVTLKNVHFLFIKYLSFGIFRAWRGRTVVEDMMLE